MTAIFLKVMPLFLASTLSPGILALTVILLSQKKSGVSRTFALLLGSIITSTILIAVAFYVGHIINDPSNTKSIDNIVDIVLGVLFVYFGIKAILVKDDHAKTKQISANQSHDLLKWLLIGFIVSITNFDSIVFTMTATKEIAQAAISGAMKMLLLVIGIFFFNLPIIFPFAMYLIAPKAVDKILIPINKFLTKYGRYIVASIFLIFAVYLFYNGFRHF